MVKTDCFAYNKEKEECNCLNKLYCINENCKFYKTREQIIKEKYISR